ncbi:serine hydrolase domain-containing protein [Amycolatopsis sp. lyj-90]|uniref:serine hydrolase domain-containing protein n=1 Tax=Amycolatopsis sp. lyj-90 TaxID=2789285 RepID=UPI00397985AC
MANATASAAGMSFLVSITFGVLTFTFGIALFAGRRKTSVKKSIRRPVRGAGVLALVGLLSVGMNTAADSATATARKSNVQASIDSLVKEQRFPAALISVTKNGRTANLVAGTSSIDRQIPVPRDGYVRAASSTKPFVSVVVLQLVAEGRVDLDTSIERYLPGVVRGKGIDANAITVRHLLQHTSGIPDYEPHVGLRKFEDIQHKFFQPHDLLAIAFEHPADFAPGTSWNYSNTNYVIAGLMIERLTGRPVQEQLKQRVIDRIGLQKTYWPPAGDQTIRMPHAQGYVIGDAVTRKVIDATEMDPSWGWAAGQLNSTPGDLAKFARSLVDGELLPPAQLAEMRRTVDAPLFPGSRYGLGLFSIPLSCGGVYWGHGGDIPGYETRGGATDDGRSVGLAVTALPGTFGDGETQGKAVLAAVDKAFCA